LGVTPLNLNNERRKRLTQGDSLFYSGLQLGHKLSVRGGFTHRFPHISLRHSSPLPWLLCEFRFRSIRRYRKVGPAPQPRFELGTTDSESVVLPLHQRGMCYPAS
jgi:hypothetical protein